MRIAVARIQVGCRGFLLAAVFASSVRPMPSNMGTHSFAADELQLTPSHPRQYHRPPGQHDQQSAEAVAEHVDSLGLRLPYALLLACSARHAAYLTDHVIRTVTKNSRTLRFNRQGFEKE